MGKGSETEKLKNKERIQNKRNRKLDVKDTQQYSSYDIPMQFKESSRSNKMMLSKRRLPERQSDTKSKHITIDPTITEIPTAIYADCHLLQSITFATSSSSSLPSSSSCNLLKIGRYAFRCCTSLTKISIPNSVQEIEYGAFMGCDSLTTLDIPFSVRKIHNFAFCHCAKLVHVSFSTPPSITVSTVTSSTSSGASLISDNNQEKEEVTVSSSSSSSSSNIKLATLEIYPAAFKDCKSLISIVIPSHVTFVIPPSTGYDIRNPPPFGNCTKLECFHFKYNDKKNDNKMPKVGRSRGISSPNNNNATTTTTTTTTSITDMNTWLQNRYNDLPLHQLCSKSNLTQDQLNSFLKKYTKQQQQQQNHHHHYHDNNEQKIITSCSSSSLNDNDCDPLDLTPLHILACSINNNDNTSSSSITPTLIQTLIQYNPNYTSIQAMNKMTPVQLFLHCHGLLNFTLLNCTPMKFDYMVFGKGKDITSRSRSRSSNGRGGNGSVEKILEYGWKWKIVNCMIAFGRLEDDVRRPPLLSYNDDDDHNDSDRTNMNRQNNNNGSNNGLCTFMNAAIMKQCDLEVVYQLTLANIGYFV